MPGLARKHGVRSSYGVFFALALLVFAGLVLLLVFLLFELVAFETVLATVLTAFETVLLTVLTALPAVLPLFAVVFALLALALAFDLFAVLSLPPHAMPRSPSAS